MHFVLIVVSLLVRKHRQVARRFDRLAARLPQARDLLRGSLLDRIIRHRTGCPKCDRGEGHPVSVLALGYPGRRTRQISLHKQQVPHVKRCLENYHKLKSAIEEICELNQQLLRAEPAEDRKGKRGQCLISAARLSAASPQD